MVRILENQQKNIYMSRFWNFHKFIENKFLSWLSKNNIDYNDIDHSIKYLKEDAKYFNAIFSKFCNYSSDFKTRPN